MFIFIFISLFHIDIIPTWHTQNLTLKLALANAAN